MTDYPDKKPYYSLNAFYRKTFGEKVYKIALDGGFTCPNRDGTLGYGGCIFCSRGGSGDFAGDRALSIREQIEDGRRKSEASLKKHGTKYIAYFQAFTNTYAPVDRLSQLYYEAVTEPDIVGISIATRPDCLSPEIMTLLSEVNSIKPVFVELGLQTIHESTAQFIRRNYSLSCFDKSVRALQSIDIPVIVHVILGLPNETDAQILDTVRYVNSCGISGIKLQMLHILKDTDLLSSYRKNPFPVLTKEHYVDLICKSISCLSENIVIHRLTGDGPRDQLIAPLWSLNKRNVLNTIHKELKQRKIHQGDHICRIH